MNFFHNNRNFVHDPHISIRQKATPLILHYVTGGEQHESAATIKQSVGERKQHNREHEQSQPLQPRREKGTN